MRLQIRIIKATDRYCKEREENPVPINNSPADVQNHFGILAARQTHAALTHAVRARQVQLKRIGTSSLMQCAVLQTEQRDDSLSYDFPLNKRNIIEKSDNNKR